MRARSRLSGLAVALTATLTLTACGGDGGGTGGGGAAPEEAPELGTSAINPVDPAQLRDGGDLRWPINNYPQNLNYHQFDGTEADTEDVTDPLMPQVFLIQPDGTAEVDTNYMTSVELTSPNPQVVTYTINPEAVWSDGTPITWEDFRAQWQALNGTNPAYNVSATNSYAPIASVEMGVDDKQAVVTWSTPFSDWQSAFSPLYPASTNGDPEAFNTGWLEEPQVTSGPFQLQAVDRTAQQIILERNPNWWGPTPKLDRIIFRLIDSAAMPNALANGEIDFYEIASDISLFERAQGIPNVDVRKALAPDMRHFTFNGAEGSIMADQQLRIAVQKGIDRTQIAQAMLGRIVPDPVPLGNHIYRAGQEGFQDNDAIVEYNPEEAGAMLDELGWVREGEGTRMKDGQPLAIRMVIPTNTATSEQEARIAQEQLRQIGVDLQIQAVPLNDFFEKHILVGDFDVTVFSWLGTAFPVSSTRSIYTLNEDTQQNFGRIGNETINQLYDEATTVLDEQRKIELANQIDTEIWASGHSLLLYQRPNVYAVNSNLANFGAFGFADEVYTVMGFVQ
ncbi:ABC transporter family substrate-binding protein [Pseudonocardia nigra]|uniref:ABC transporter family substrate-binding protein n=1 Tax=Pseudonocardia nigra TaxID=1921578 RepID=UPI001C5E1C0D|nr:ABC transporter family substrate-binding protein [Pseudonocardia nigra]